MSVEPDETRTDSFTEEQLREMNRIARRKEAPWHRIFRLPHRWSQHGGPYGTTTPRSTGSGGGPSASS